MQIKRFLWLSGALAVLRKDLRTEFRTRHAYSALVMFAVTTLVTVSFSVGGLAPGSEISASLLWVIIFFSAMAGLPRTFIQEEETGTAIALKMSAEPETIFWGKYFFNLALLLSLAIVLLPLYLILLNLTVALPSGLLATLFLGIMGLAGAGTILAAIVSKASAKGSLMTVLAFPVLLPLLLSAVSATRIALGGGSPAAINIDIILLLFYNGFILVASLLLFRYVWNE